MTNDLLISTRQKDRLKEYWKEKCWEFKFPDTDTYG